MNQQQLEEIKECNPRGKVACYCDNGHEQVNTVCMYHWVLGYRTWKELWGNPNMFGDKELWGGK